MKQVPCHHGGMELEYPTGLAGERLVVKTGPLSTQSPQADRPGSRGKGTQKPLDTVMGGHWILLTWQFPGSSPTPPSPGSCQEEGKLWLMIPGKVFSPLVCA